VRHKANDDVARAI